MKQTLCPLLIFKHGPLYVHHIAKVKVEPRTFLPFDQNTPMFVLREKPLSNLKEVWQVDKLLQTLRIIMEGASKDMTNAKSQCKVKQRCKIVSYSNKIINQSMLQPHFGQVWG